MPRLKKLIHGSDYTQVSEVHNHIDKVILPLSCPGKYNVLKPLTLELALISAHSYDF